MTGSFAGLKVLEVGGGMAGSLATMILADNGADVVKIEFGRRDPYSSKAGYHLWSRGKRRVLLQEDETLASNAALDALAKGADVFMAAWPPLLLRQRGLDYEALAAANPRLVYATITGFGWKSPLSDCWNSEDLARARVGLMMDQKGFRAGPIFSYPRTGSFSAAMLSLQGILAALLVRDRTGSGQMVDVSLLRAVLGREGYSFIKAQKFQDDLGSLGFDLTDPRGSVPMYNMNQCSDGRWLQLACQNRKFAEKGLPAVGLAHLWQDPRFKGLPRAFESDADRKLFLGMMREAIAKKPLAEWLRIFQEHDAPAVPVHSTVEFMDHPQLEPNGLKVTLNDPELGPMVQPGLLMELSDTPGSIAPTSPVTRELVWKPVASRTAAPPSRGKKKEKADFTHGPLTGLKVLDLTTVWAGPSSTRFLADMGAEVTKVESLQGDSLRNAADSFLFANRGKASIAVNLKTPEGLDILKRLVRDADVMAHNYRPGVAERLGIDYAAMRDVNPRIIYAHLTAYGNKGPYRTRPGFDPIFAAMSGLSLEQSGEGNPPTMMGITDISVGLSIATSILTALHVRERTGKGQNIEIAMVGVVSYMLGDAFTSYAGKPPAPRVDKGQHGLGPLYRLYAAQQGWVFLACVTDADWAKLQGLLNLKELADGRFATAELRARHGEELSNVLASVFSGKTADEWEAASLSAGVPCASVRLAHDDRFVSDPGPGIDPFVSLFEHPVYGAMTQPALPISMSKTPGRVRPVEPHLGQQTDEILSALGFTPPQIEAYRHNKVVG